MRDPWGILGRSPRIGHGSGSDLLPTSGRTPASATRFQATPSLLRSFATGGARLALGPLGLGLVDLAMSLVSFPHSQGDVTKCGMEPNRMGRWLLLGRLL